MAPSRADTRNVTRTGSSTCRHSLTCGSQLDVSLQLCCARTKESHSGV